MKISSVFGAGGDGPGYVGPGLPEGHPKVIAILSFPSVVLIPQYCVRIHPSYFDSDQGVDINPIRLTPYAQLSPSGHKVLSYLFYVISSFLTL